MMMKKIIRNKENTNQVSLSHHHSPRIRNPAHCEFCNLVSRNCSSPTPNLHSHEALLTTPLVIDFKDSREVARDINSDDKLVRVRKFVSENGFNRINSKDKNVVLLGEDIGIDGGVFRVTDGLIKKFPNRVIDTPLAESGIVGTSIGMALNGIRPVAEIQFSGFMYPAFDQLISHAARIRNRTRGAFSCPIVIRTPYSGGIKALEHHSESMEAIYVHIPCIILQ